jgi:hypothetical protein
MSQYIYVTHASKIKTEVKAEGMGRALYSFGENIFLRGEWN